MFDWILKTPLCFAYGICFEILFESLLYMTDTIYCLTNSLFERNQDLRESFFVNQYVLFKDIYRENTPSNKTKALTRKYEYAQFGNWYIKSAIQKQRSRGGLSKRCSENMLQIYRRTPHFGMGVLL